MELKMKINNMPPKKLKLSGSIYDIKYLNKSEMISIKKQYDSKDDLLGLTDSYKCVIYIDSEQSIDSQKITLLHEIYERESVEKFYDTTYKMYHRIIYILSDFYYDFIYNNKRWIYNIINNKRMPKKLIIESIPYDIIYLSDNQINNPENNSNIIIDESKDSIKTRMHGYMDKENLKIFLRLKMKKDQKILTTIKLITELVILSKNIKLTRNIKQYCAILSICTYRNLKDNSELMNWLIS